jgi:hypothetical protein
MGRLCELLAGEQDLPLAKVPGKLRALGELTQMRVQVARLVERLRLAEDTHAVEDRDWSDLVRRGQELLRFLASQSGPVLPEVIRALTVAEVRARVAEAVRIADAARVGGVDESWEFLTQLFDTDQDVSSGITIDSAPLTDLHGWLAARAKDAHRIQEWTQFREIEREITRVGVLQILQEVLHGQVRLMEAAGAFQARFLHLWLDALHEAVPALRQFSADRHEWLAEQFRALDRCSIETAPARVRNHLLTRPDRPATCSGAAPGSSELGILLREVHKRRRHLPLRKLFAAIPSGPGQK